MNKELLSKIYVWFDFTTDTKGFWNGFWERNGGLGAGAADPDAKSQTMRDYHRLLWSRELPNGEVMQLVDGRSRYYLHWKDFYFGSDSITASFRYYRNREFLEEVKKEIPNYNSFVEDYIRKLYTIGGEMLFPSFMGCINQARGCNLRICDRWDLTLECIKRYYSGEDSPLSKALAKNTLFFDLFIDFKGFVDFFFLNDCVDESYNVKMWLDTPLFITNSIPKTIDDYLRFLDFELDFVANRNRRINNFIQQI